MSGCRPASWRGRRRSIPPGFRVSGLDGEGVGFRIYDLGARGSWLMFHGSWVMVHGLWFMTDSLWVTGHGFYVVVYRALRQVRHVVPPCTRGYHNVTTKSKLVVQSTLLAPRPNRFTSALPPRTTTFSVKRASPRQVRHCMAREHVRAPEQTCH